MPRNQKDSALQALVVAVANWERATAAAADARRRLEATMIRCVNAGVTRTKVAYVTGVSNQRISQIEGMPPGQKVAPSSTLR